MDFNNLVKAAMNRILALAGPSDSTSFNVNTELTAATSAQTVKAAVSSNYLYITDISISVDTAMSVKLQDNTGTPIMAVARKFLPANSVWTKNFKTPIKIAVGKSLDAVCSASSGNVTTDIGGYYATT